MNDFKIPKKFLSISDFFKLACINRKNLMHYDSIGILKHAFAKENGYRYYLYSQLDDVNIIFVYMTSFRNYLEIFL